MSQCSYQSSLEAYYDRQSPPELASRIREHLPTCAACAAELDRLARLSSLLATIRPEPIRTDELARLHRAVDEVEDHGILRLVGGLSAVAASILIISMAWLYDGPTARGPTMIVESAPQQSWERMASAGRADDPINVPQTGTAQGDIIRRDTTDWMVVGMGR